MLKTKILHQIQVKKNEFTFCVQIDTTKAEREPKLKDIKKDVFEIKRKILDPNPT